MLSKRNKDEENLTKPVFLSSPCEALKFIISSFFKICCFSLKHGRIDRYLLTSFRSKSLKNGLIHIIVRSCLNLFHFAVTLDFSNVHKIFCLFFIQAESVFIIQHIILCSSLFIG